MRNQIPKRITALGLSATLLAGFSLPVHGQSKSTAVQILENEAKNQIEKSQATLYDSMQKPVVIGSDVSTSPEELADRIQKGEATAVKAGVFRSEDEALYGIVQLTFDIAGKENESEKPVNVLLILDQTGSMNMYTATPSTFQMDCLNPDHYYFIPAGTFGNHGAGYLKLNEFNPEGPVFKSWYGTDENGKDYVARWVVDMLNTLPKDQAAQQASSEPEAATDTALQAGEEGQASVLSSSPADEDVSKQADAPASPAVDRTSEILSQPAVRTPEPAPLSNPVSAAPALQAEDGAEESSQLAEPEYEEVEEWIEIPQEPILQTVTETVTVTPEPYTVTETELRKTEQEPILNEETGELEEPEPVYEEVQVEKTVAPEPYETTVEKQVEIPQEPIRQKVVRKVLKQQASSEPPAASAADPAVLTDAEKPAFEEILQEQAASPDTGTEEVSISNQAGSELQIQGSEGSGESSDLGSPAADPSDSGGSELLSADVSADVSADAVYHQAGVSAAETSKTDPAAVSVQTAALEASSRQSDLYAPVYDSGYDVNFHTIIQWNPGNNHYHLENGVFKKIEQPAYVSQSVNGFDPDYTFYSPDPDNPYGCTDRMILSKQYARDFIERLFSKNPENRVAIELFNNQDEPTFRTDFTSSMKDLDSALNFRDGGSNTNYDLAFSSALDMVQNSKGFMKDCGLYTIFVSDGQPNRSLMKYDPALEETYQKYGGFDYYAGYISAKRFREEVPQTLYAVGLQTDIEDYLSLLASSPKDAYNCTSMEEFNEFLKYVEGTWQKASPKNGVLEDAVADGFSLLIDPDHPFVIDGASYSSVSALPSNVAVEGKKISVSLGELAESGRRISFFVKASPELLANQEEWKKLPTNASASLTYNPVRLENRDLVYGSTETVELKSPLAEFAGSVITSRKSSSREGEEVRPGEEIEYTIHLKNAGLLDLETLYVSDLIPEGTEYVSGGDFKNGTVRFELKDLLAGSEQAVSFTVRVLDDALDNGIDRIENSGLFGTQLDENGDPKLPTNEVENPLVPNPEPEPTPTPTPTPTPVPTPVSTPEKMVPASGTASPPTGLIAPSAFSPAAGLIVSAAGLIAAFLEKRKKR